MLDTLPTELLETVVSFLGTPDKAALACTCRRLRDSGWRDQAAGHTESNRFKAVSWVTCGADGEEEPGRGAPPARSARHHLQRMSSLNHFFEIVA